MRSVPHSIRSFGPSLSFILLIFFFAVLEIAGGTSRSDQLAQPIVRGAAWLLLIVAVLFGKRKQVLVERPVWIFLFAMIALAILQLIPLPPKVWGALPGRERFLEAALLAGAKQPWRPLALVPSAALNALSSMVVPLAVLVFATGLPARERKWLPTLILVLVTVAMLVGLLQLTGARIDDPFIDSVPGAISGNFANRNHFALFLSFGVLVVPVWAFGGRTASKWRWPAASGLAMLFFLTILATGSRAGMAVGLIAVILSLGLTKRHIQHAFQRYPRWLLPALAIATIGLAGTAITVSIWADRAVSIHRLFVVTSESEMRREALPAIWRATRDYLPFGSGLGAFATVYQIYEPSNLLSISYLNRAHNDYLEIALTTGLPGLTLLICALGWWLVAGIRTWRAASSSKYAISKVGWGILLIVFVASVFDYPARTPLMMAIITLAALWLCWENEQPRSTLPPQNRRV